MSTFEMIKASLGPRFPNVASDTIDEFATLLAEVADGKLTPQEFPTRFAAHSSFTALGPTLIGQQLRLGQSMFSFDNAGRPYWSGVPSIDARNSQGAIINPAGLVIQIITSGAPASSPPPPARLRVFISYDDQDPMAQAVVNQLRTQLEPPNANFEVLIAPQTITIGQSWRNDLYTVMGLAHAAVLLLSAGATKSEAVYKTASLLAVRPLVEIFKFIFVPVLLDPVMLVNLNSAESELASLKLETFFPIKSYDPAEISLHVLDRLKPLSAIPYHATRLEMLGQAVGALFREKQINETTLQYIAASTGWNFEHEPELCTQMSWAMWNTDFQTALKTIQYLAYIFEQSYLQKVLMKISPGWVNPWAARWIPVATVRDEGRAIVVNGQDTFIVQCFVRRAFCVLDAGKVVDMMDKADGLTVDSLIDTIRNDLSITFRYRKPPSDSELEERLISHTTNIGPVFVVLPIRPPQDVVKLMKTFEYVTFFFLTGRDLPDSVDSYPNVIFLKPALRSDEVNASDAYLLYDDEASLTQASLN